MTEAEGQRGVRAARDIDAADVSEVYEGPAVEFYQLIMGQLLHIGGLRSSLELAERAAIGAGDRGVDLCCGNGASMRVLVRQRGVAAMTGLDASPSQIERARRGCEDEGLAERIRLVVGDACDTGLPGGEADFVWAEDAWCYVPEKPRLVAEAVRLVRPGGAIAFTDWVEGPARLSESEADRFLGVMTFPNVLDVESYRDLLEAEGCEVLEAADTGRLARCFDLYCDMIELQHTYDALRIANFDADRLAAMQAGLEIVRSLGHAQKVSQARFIARRRPG